VSEVVVLLTSLGAKRTEFNAGRRICDLLETKRVHRKILDLNKDVQLDETVAKSFQRLVERDQVLTSEDESDLCLPQIFIDGCYAGGDLELQNLEDDGLLGRILRRQVCVKCHAARSADSMVCGNCGFEFEEILPEKYTMDDALDNCEADPRDDEGCESDSEIRFDAYKKALEASGIIDGSNWRSRREDPIKGCAKRHKRGHCKDAPSAEKAGQDQAQKPERKESEQMPVRKQTKAITPITQNALDEALARKRRVWAKLRFAIKAVGSQAASNRDGYPPTEAVEEIVPVTPGETTSDADKPPVEIESIVHEEVLASTTATTTVERRLNDGDGIYYTKEEFLDYFGEEDGLKRWEASPKEVLPTQDPEVVPTQEAKPELIKSRTCAVGELDRANTEEKAARSKDRCKSTGDLDRKQLVEAALLEVERLNARSRAATKESNDADADEQQLALQEVDRLNARKSAVPAKEIREEDRVAATATTSTDKASVYISAEATSKEGDDVSRTPTVEQWLETRADGSSTTRISIHKTGPPELLRGVLWKKSPQLFRLRSFDQRYVIVDNAQIAWWNSEKEAPALGSSFVPGGSQCKGYINLKAGGVDVVYDRGNETTFTVKPKTGQWADGATHQAKGGKERSFTFDTNGTEFSREFWASAIRRQMQVAELLKLAPAWGVQKSPLEPDLAATLE